MRENKTAYTLTHPINFQRVVILICQIVFKDLSWKGKLRLCFLSKKKKNVFDLTLREMKLENILELL